jgi:2'-5' RNA ligase
VGLWPPPEVVEHIGVLSRPPIAGVRWTTAGQWHATLLFLGTVVDADRAPVIGALAAAAGALADPIEVTMGPATVRLGRGVLCVPLLGLEAAAEEVRRAMAGVLAVEDGPFRGHLTLARARRNRAIPPELTGVACAARWTARQLCVISSRLEPSGARYDTLATAPLGPP